MEPASRVGIVRVGFVLLGGVGAVLCISVAWSQLASSWIESGPEGGLASRVARGAVADTAVAKLGADQDSARREGEAELPNRQGAAAAEPSLAHSRRRAYERMAERAAPLAQFSEGIEAVVDYVRPAVVHIRARHLRSLMRHNITVQETGSGVLVRLGSAAASPSRVGPQDRLLVLTNYHVVEGASPEQLLISTLDGRRLHAAEVRSDPESDVALVYIAEQNVPVCEIGDSDRVRVGQLVLALGSPFNLAGSVTLGIVSGKGRRSLALGWERSQRRMINQDFIQTDAAINPGNSGGPLIDLEGRVIGIITAIASQSGGSEGVAFVTPINLVKWVAEQLLTEGRVRRAALGVGLNPVIAGKLGLDRARGALVQEIYKGLPADLAGLEPLDVILEFNGQRVQDRDHLIHLATIAPIGKQVKIVVWRNRQPVTLQARLCDRDQLERSTSQLSKSTTQDAQLIEDQGMWVRPIREEDRAKFGYAVDHKGLLVVGIPTHSLASHYLEPFDLIEHVDGRPVRSADELISQLERLADGLPVKLRVARSTLDGVVRKEIVLRR